MNIFHIFNRGREISKSNNRFVTEAAGMWKENLAVIGNKHNKRVHKKLIANSPLNLGLLMINNKSVS